MCLSVSNPSDGCWKIFLVERKKNEGIFKINTKAYTHLYIYISLTTFFLFLSTSLFSLYPVGGVVEEVFPSFEICLREREKSRSPPVSLSLSFGAFSFQVSLSMEPLSLFSLSPILHLSPFETKK